MVSFPISVYSVIVNADYTCTDHQYSGAGSKMHVFAKSSVKQVLAILIMYVTEVLGLYNMQYQCGVAHQTKWQQQVHTVSSRKIQMKEPDVSFSRDLRHTTHSYTILHGGLPGMELFAMSDHARLPVNSCSISPCLVTSQRLLTKYPIKFVFCTGNILNPMTVYQLKRYLLTASQPDHGFYQ